MNDVPLDDLTLTSFAPLVGTVCRACLGTAGVVELELTEAVPHRAAARAGAGGPPGDSFSLFFHGPADRPLGQRTYSIEHDQIGRFDLFLVPVGRDARGMQYQAVFNRLPRPC